MNLHLKVVVGVLALVTVMVAQEASKSKATTDAAVSKKEAAQNPTAMKKGTTPDAGKRVTGTLTEKEKRGYALGLGLGSDIAGQAIEVDPGWLTQGIEDGLTGGKLRMSVEEISATLSQMQKDQRDKMALAQREFAEKNKKEGEAFLAANKAKDGIVTLPSGVQYKILKSGDGKKPGLDDQVVCNYRGTLIDGTEIDSSYKRNEPSTLPLKGVIKGWSEALQLMPVGSKWQVFIPSVLAYGDRGNGSIIGPNATLIFEVELLSIQDRSGSAAGRPKGNL